jgi:propanediol dehydratase large subunit
VAELGLLMQQAQELPEEQLDLGLTPVPVKADLVGAVGSDDDGLAGVFTDLGFASVTDEVFRSMVIARIVDPNSRT